MIRDAKQIIEKSIQAVLPEAAVKAALREYAITAPCRVVAIGKAAWRMAQAACEVLGDLVECGVVLTKYRHSQGVLPRMEIFEAGHPVPDENSVIGTQAVLQLTENLTKEDTVLFLVSGGGSALFEVPADGVSLADLAQVTKALLASGADIAEINAVRKHLSKVKGGLFAKHCAPAKVRTIVLSDVLGDPLDSIASGPAHPDSSTVADVKRILAKYHLDFPPNVLSALVTETPKTLSNAENRIAGNVTALCEAAAKEAASLGYSPLLLTTTLSCEAREAGAFLAAIAREIHATGAPVKPPCAVILGGETVVHLKGNGVGGRNQELVVSAIEGIHGLPNTVLFSVGSDGTDGPTDAAGGLVTGDTLSKCASLVLKVDDYLQNNDAYHLLQALDGLLITGPTGTNVNDLTLLLVR